MNPVAGTFFDGNNLRPVGVTVEFGADDRLRVRGEGVDCELAMREVRISDRLARVPRFLRLPGGGVIETQDNDAVDQALVAQRRGLPARLIHYLETRSAIAAAAALVVVLLAFASFYFGLPALARHTAGRTPRAIGLKAGEAALAALDQQFAPSSLSPEQRRRVKVQLQRLQQPGQPAIEMPRLEYRSIGAAANAFALPGGIIVVSDELVRLAEHDDEIAAVLAHELGHLELRHGIQSMLRNSFALLIVTALTGDLSTLTTFAGTIPFLILTNGYSREFEEEADIYAHDLMLRRNIRLKHFASILQKMEAGRLGGKPRLGYLSTHPATDERIKLFQPGGPVAEPASTAPKLVAVSQPEQATVTFAPDSNATASLPRHIQIERAIYTFPKLDILPVPVQQTPAEYPAIMKASHVSGEVTVNFVVDRGGDVRSPYVVQSTRREFDIAAISAINRWKFAPGRKNGEAANARVTMTIRFNADENGTE